MTQDPAVRDEYIDHRSGDWSCRRCWALVRYIFLGQHLEWHAQIDGSLESAGSMEDVQ